jgi:hypothetical protein
VLLVCALAFGFLLIPDAAFGWGPISHLAHGSEVLKSLTILGAGLQQLLGRFPMEYLYGCVGADITLGKKYTRAMQAHCHSWQVGWQVLDAAESDEQRAFAYGYLTHLAADVYSHNHDVPTQLIVSYRARTLRHVYWEARFDGMQDASYRGIVTDLRRLRFPECDRLVKRVVARTLFSFDTNKRIFDSVLAFHDWKNWHRIVQSVSTRSRHHLPDAVVPLYNAACSRNITDVLERGRRADCQSADPTGLEALTRAKEVRRRLKALARRGAVTPAIEAELETLNRRRDLILPAPAAGGERARAHG